MLKLFLVVFGCTFCAKQIGSTTVQAQAPLSPTQVVQLNLDAYNQRNIEGFMAWIDDKVQVVNFQDQKITLTGKDNCKAFYQTLFEQSPQLHSTILSRMVLGNKVIDHERIVGRNGAAAPVELILIYEVEHNKITKINVIRP